MLFPSSAFAYIVVFNINSQCYQIYHLVLAFPTVSGTVLGFHIVIWLPLSTSDFLEAPAFPQVFIMIFPYSTEAISLNY